jgi:hypothetical protein
MGESKMSEPWKDYKKEKANPWEEYQEEGLREIGTSPLSLIGQLFEGYETVVREPIRSKLYKAQGGETTGDVSGKMIAEKAGLPAPSVSGFIIEEAADPLTIMGGVSAIKKAKNVIPLAEKASKTAYEKALKAAGAMKADFKKLAKTGKQDLLGKFALDEGLVKVGDTVESIAVKSQQMVDDIGEKIGNLYEKLTKGEIQIPGKQLSNKIRSDVAASFENPISSEIALETIEAELNRITNKNMTPKELLSYKKHLDKKINWGKATQQLPETQQTYLAARNSVNDWLIELADQARASSKSKELADLNRKYSNAIKIQEMAQAKEAAFATNRAFSLTDYLSGAAGGSVGSTVGTGGAVLGTAAGMAFNNLARKFGPAIAAKILESSAPGLKRIDPVLSAIRGRPGLAAYSLGKGLQLESNLEKRIKALEE